MKRKLNQLFLVAALMCGAMSVISCQGLIDAIIGDHTGSSSGSTTKPVTPDDPPTYASDAVRPLTFEAAVDGVTVMLKFSDNAKPDYKKVEYSLDAGATWTALSSPAQPILLEKAGDIVMFRGDNPTYNGDAQFVVEQAASQTRGNTRAGEAIINKPLLELYGNLFSLIKTKKLTGAEQLIEENAGAFEALFKDAYIETLHYMGGETRECLVLPSIGEGVVVPNAFKSLFENTLIAYAPKVSVGTVAENTLAKMYKDCPRLKKATFELGTTAEGVTVEQAMGEVLGGTTGSEAEGGKLEIEWDRPDYIPLPNTLTLDDLMGASGLSTEVLANTTVSIDENGTISIAEKYGGVTGVEIRDMEGKIENGKLELTVGVNYIVNATVTPTTASDKSIAWSSDNPDIAIYDTNDARIHAFFPGTTKIWAIHGESFKASIEVIVNLAPVAVTGITLDQAELELEIGGTATLKATVTPENASDAAVTWSTSDDKVAKVENGKVTAVAAGTATITAKAGDKTAECKVTVTAKTVAVTGVKLNNTKLDLTVGESETLTATVSPNNASDKTVSWKSDKTGVATVDKNGKVTAVGVGEATITVTTKDGEKTATCTVKVTEKPEETPDPSGIGAPDNYGSGENPF